MNVFEMFKKNIFLSKYETLSLIIIFAILVCVSIPNFALSLRRSRDQIRRDDLGSLMEALDSFYSYFGVFPLSSTDNKIMNCPKPNGIKPFMNESGVWIFDVISCNWGKDPFYNLATDEKYMQLLPQDPKWENGSNYFYISDGKRYQIFAAMEGKDEAEVDTAIINMNLNCGDRTCNVGRSYNCDFPKTVQECGKEALSQN